MFPAMNLNQELKRILSPLRNEVSRRWQAKQLKRTSALRCQSAHLRPRANINLRELFSLPEYESAWDKINNQVQDFGIPVGRGGVNSGDRRALYYLIKHFQPATVLEIGTHIGASTVHISAALSTPDSAGENARPRLVTVDITDVNDPVRKPWMKHGSQWAPKEMVAKLGLASTVQFVVDDSLHYLSNCSQRFDFIFLDGDHSAKTVYQEIPAALSVLNEGGLIVLHDYFPNTQPLWSSGFMLPGPFFAVERHINEGSNLVALPLGELPWPTRFNSNRTSLALLLRG